MIVLDFKPWRRFSAKKDTGVIRRWLREVSRRSESVFKAGLSGPHSGRIYYRRGGRHQASAPGEYPANDSGKLVASLRTRANTTEATIGTNVHYAKYLRTGTRKMARRKMSDDALKEGALLARPASKGWVKWARHR